MTNGVECPPSPCSPPGLYGEKTTCGPQDTETSTLPAPAPLGGDLRGKQLAAGPGERTDGQTGEFRTRSGAPVLPRAGPRPTARLPPPRAAEGLRRERRSTAVSKEGPGPAPGPPPPVLPPDLLPETPVCRPSRAVFLLCHLLCHREGLSAGGKGEGGPAVAGGLQEGPSSAKTQAHSAGAAESK